MADFRVDTSFFRHIKTKRLKRALGLEGVFALMQLWAYAAECKYDDGRVYTADDIETAVDWQGPEGNLVERLVEIGFLDISGDVYKIHEWGVHNGWAATAAKRSEVSRKASQSKWGGLCGGNETRSQRLSDARKKGSHQAAEWKAMVEFFGATCVKCGADGKIVKDHIIPIYQGGSDCITNIQPLCKTCNSSKGSDNTDYRRQAADAKGLQLPALWTENACDKNQENNRTPAQDNKNACASVSKNACAEDLTPPPLPSPLPLPSPIPLPIPKQKSEVMLSLCKTPPPALAPAGAKSARKVSVNYCTQQFEIFWEAFGDKRGRAPAWNAWLKIKGLDRKLMETIIAGARRYASQRQAILANKGTPKMAQGWLSDRRWEDEDAVAMPETAASSPELDAAFARVMEGADGPSV